MLLTRVEHVKHTLHKDFAIVDAAMNDLLRPALYDAWQEIVPVHQRRQDKVRRYDVVGPVCESETRRRLEELSSGACQGQCRR